MRRPRAVVLLIPAMSVVTALTSCSDTPSATVTVTLGEELDALSRTPAPTTLIVENVALDGAVTELSRTALPADDITLGDKTRTDVGSFRVTAVDATGKRLLAGETLLVQFGALESAALSVFVQRTGELARFPAAAVATGEAPRIGIAADRYLLAATGTSTYLYDLLLLRSSISLPALPRPAKSLATFGTAAVVIDEAGASTIDLTNGNASTLAAPTGGTFAEIAGGASTTATDGTIYVVGATRASGSTTRVFSISPAGAVAFAALAVAREGACAAWVEGRGVFVYGGGGEGAAAEILATGASVGTPLPFPADPVKGCGAAALDGSHVLVVGGAGSKSDVAGAAPARVVDLACTSNCAPTAWTAPLPLVRAEAFTLAADAALVVGDDAAGASRAFRVTPTSATEIALRAARRGARLIALPVKGTAALVGGAASIEQYRE